MIYSIMDIGIIANIYWVFILCEILFWSSTFIKSCSSLYKVSTSAIFIDKEAGTTQLI